MKPRAFTYALSDNASGIVYMLVASACLIVNDTSRTDPLRVDTRRSSRSFES